MNAGPSFEPATPPFHWPDPPLQVVLIEPEIPPNTGNIARLCAATGSALHLVGPLGFRLSDRRLRRAGVNCWDSVRIVRHEDLDGFRAAVGDAPLFLFSARGDRAYTAGQYRPGAFLVFGGETRGLPAALLDGQAGRVFRIPMRGGGVRSLNLSSAVAVVLYEAIRQMPSPPLPHPVPSGPPSHLTL